MIRLDSHWLRALSLLAAVAVSLHAADTAKPSFPNMLEDSSFSNILPSWYTWEGADTEKRLRVPFQNVPIVSDSGTLDRTPFPPGIAAASFVGNGLIDLIVADSDGRLWYYRNSGTQAVPEFSTGEPLPFFLGQNPQSIQAVDFDGDGRPDLVLGDGPGRLFFLRNVGNGDKPKFDSAGKADQIQTRTRHDGKPWCNFLSPAYAAWVSGTAKDLILGDGTYASDNVYFLKNKGTTDRPQFDDPVVLIVGGGREHLVPQPWPRTPKGPFDLLVADRTGHFTLHPNQSVEGDPIPKFGLAQPIKLGSSEIFGPLPRFAVADLNGDGRPDIIFTDTDGGLRVAYNTGSVDQPKFDKADPIKGTFAGKPRAMPTNWTFNSPWWLWGVPPSAFYFNLRLVGVDPREVSTYEEGLTIPDGAKRVMKFEVTDPPSGTGPFPAIPTDENGMDMAFNLFYCTNDTMSLGVHGISDKTNYEFVFQVKGDMPSLLVTVSTTYRVIEKKGGATIINQKSIQVKHETQVGGSWQEVRVPFPIEMEKGGENLTPVHIILSSVGKGNYYVANPIFRQAK